MKGPKSQCGVTVVGLGTGTSMIKPLLLPCAIYSERSFCLFFTSFTSELFGELDSYGTHVEWDLGLSALIANVTSSCRK